MKFLSCFLESPTYRKVVKKVTSRFIFLYRTFLCNFFINFLFALQKQPYLSFKNQIFYETEQNRFLLKVIKKLKGFKI
jgi:hypothetical protein